MGKRKERRLAAKTTANRRVKLDLLAEPSGDFGESSNKEVGSAKNHAESPNSPSSSGQRPENPLLLLGQYSDDEVEEESAKEISHDTRENSPADLDEQQHKAESHEGSESDKDENVDHSCSLDVLNTLEENGVIEDNTVVSHHKDTDAVEVEQTAVPWTSDAQTTGEVDSGWKMVLHEESNSYYYWNTVTGETSWEIPASLAQNNDAPNSAIEVKEMHMISLDSHVHEANLEAETVGSFATQPNCGTTDTLEDGEIGCSSRQDEKDKGILGNDEDEGNHVDIIEGRKVCSPDTAGYGGFVKHNNDASSNGAHCGVGDIKDDVNQGIVPADSSSDSLRLLQLGENLLERLKSLKGSAGFSDEIAKLMFELDIRLADIKSLVPYGSSLLPFWLHSENHLKKLESALNNQILNYEMNVTTNKAHENIYEATTNEKNSASTSLEFNISDHDANLNKDVEKDHGNAGPNCLEDVDMDVEMELEEGEVETESGAHQQSIPSNTDAQQESIGSEKFEVPPPPNDDWIPPPPPDDEPLPPPPPDEPPLEPEMQVAQAPYSYGEQQYTYAGPGYEYYSQTHAVPQHSNGYYVDANGCQIAAAADPLATTLYYANPYPDSNSVSSHVGPAVTYYTTTTLQEGSVPIIGSLHKPVASEVTTTEAVSKAQPKVTRNKKRTVATVNTLRSNKKVSGLVDKWKAVKEELHEDEEDEPENSLEVLEKKRQREIEQWHAQQIASGEAKDNANFQPLGGDWRERVRRKRAKKSIETEENVTKATADTSQQPDLVELTKQLPSGWQAYWDESSKEVYYGNTITSETTWIKPTKN